MENLKRGLAIQHCEIWNNSVNFFQFFQLNQLHCGFQKLFLETDFWIKKLVYHKQTLKELAILT